MNQLRRTLLRGLTMTSFLGTLAFGSWVDGLRQRDIPDTKLAFLVADELPAPEEMELDDLDKEVFTAGKNYVFVGESEGYFGSLTVLETKDLPASEELLKEFAQGYLDARKEDDSAKFEAKKLEKGTLGKYSAELYEAVWSTSDVKVEEKGLILVGDNEIIVLVASADCSDSASGSEQAKVMDSLRYSGEAYKKLKDLELK